MIRFGRDTCSNLKEALSREWLETNGIGGFASSTIVGLNTRRCHGVLVAAAQPPVGRMVLLSKLEETLIIGAERFELSTNRYPGVVHPKGYRFLSQFAIISWRPGSGRYRSCSTATHRIGPVDASRRLGASPNCYQSRAKWR